MLLDLDSLLFILACLLACFAIVGMLTLLANLGVLWIAFKLYTEIAKYKILDPRQKG